ncbi:MAG: hypothetical protein JJE36_04825 [Coriobacteriia bacterium]|nr:hypothetical protein [Coriobacteriia bacterium]
MEKTQGKLKIFLGYAAGVGKTYAMLDAAHEQYKRGVDVVIGYVEPHARPDTVALVKDLPSIPTKKIRYRNLNLIEFDIDAALKLHPSYILVDELAHTNAPGSRNIKRYQDIQELLAAGINVYTTMNVQHIESLNDIVGQIVGVVVSETVPDSVVDKAEEIDVVDVDPQELLMRFKEGRIYAPEKAKLASTQFFTLENLAKLREIALRKASDQVNEQAPAQKSCDAVRLKLLVLAGPEKQAAKVIRASSRIADALRCNWVVLYVETPDSADFPPEQEKVIRDNLSLAERLGAEVATIPGEDIAETAAEYVRISVFTDVVVGHRADSSLHGPYHRGIECRLMEYLDDVVIHIIPEGSHKERLPRKKRNLLKRKNMFMAARTRRAELLYEITKMLLTTRGMGNIIDLSNDYLVNIFNRSSIIYAGEPGNPALGHLKLAAEGTEDMYRSQAERATARWTYINQKRAGAGTDTLGGAHMFYTPLLSHGEIFGVVGLADAMADHDERLFVKLAAGVIALAIERQRLSEAGSTNKKHRTK